MTAQKSEPGKQQQSEGKSKEGGDEGEVRVAAAKRKVALAIAFNRSHPEQVTEFDELTEGIAGKGVRAIMAWQRAHGVKADGQIGPVTLQAAKGGKAEPEQGGGASKHGGKEKKATHIEFSDDEAETVTMEDDDGERQENPALDGNLFGKHKGMEHTKDDETQEGLDRSGDLMENASKLGQATGAGAGLTERALQLAQAPKILNEIKDGKYVDAFEDLAKMVPPEEAAEVLGHVATKIGLAGAARFFEGLAACGGELMAMVYWTYEGFKQIHEAREKGNTENRIDIYADAYAYAFLFGAAGGGQAGLRATAQEKEALELGRKEGAAAAGATGELAPVIGKALIKKYGSVDGAVHHIKSYLLQQAGLAGQAAARTGEGPEKAEGGEG